MPSNESFKIQTKQTRGRLFGTVKKPKQLNSLCEKYSLVYFHINSNIPTTKTAIKIISSSLHYCMNMLIVQYFNHISTFNL